jgi:hypothetical protein
MAKWNEMKIEEPKDRKEAIKFEDGKAYEVVITSEVPTELKTKYDKESQDPNKVTMLFNCTYEGEERVFFAGAETLQWGMKRAAESRGSLQGMRCSISRIQVDGKTKYQVVLLE